MRRVTCEDIARAGLWDRSKCCVFCHAQMPAGVSGLDVELQRALSGVGLARLDLCCAAGVDADLSNPIFLKLLVGHPLAEN